MTLSFRSNIIKTSKNYIDQYLLIIFIISTYGYF
nr:MAG TPA: hypothetical protein [Caudoviricetes sp.]